MKKERAGRNRKYIRQKKPSQEVGGAGGLLDLKPTDSARGIKKGAVVLPAIKHCDRVKRCSSNTKAIRAFRSAQNKKQGTPMVHSFPSIAFPAWSPVHDSFHRFLTRSRSAVGDAVSRVVPHPRVPSSLSLFCHGRGNILSGSIDVDKLPRLCAHGQQQVDCSL
jgi:hypothetical protein